jgi:hypothetical protein
MVITKLGLIPAGGNYDHVQRIVGELRIDTSHFTGSAWNVGAQKKQTNYGKSLALLLVENSNYQSYKLKKRLFNAKIKSPVCELCGWSEKADDGRIPVELDHINGDHKDNRITNLRVLCPNCHSLQATHRGKNKKVALKKFDKMTRGCRNR